MNERGELIEWDDGRGFGFVRTETGERLFVHIKAFGALPRRPEIGDRLAFRRGFGRDGRPAAVTAQIAGLRTVRVQRGPSTEKIENAQRSRALRISASAVLLAAVIYAGDRVGASWLVGIYLLMGLASASAYWADKRAANARRWRTAETTLHMLDFAGGIIGGLLAQAALHHKTAKAGFARITWLIVAGHLVGLTLLAVGILDLR